MRIRVLLPALFLLVSVISVFSLPQTKSARRTLDIYYIDVEGGAATLIVTPAEFIANLDEQSDEANMITVSVDAAKGSFTVNNG